MLKYNPDLKGFSLVESLISLSLFLLIVISSLEFYNHARNYFFKLKEGQENNTAAYAALDKMKTDLKDGGKGLLAPLGLGILEAISSDEGALSVISREENVSILDDLLQGQSIITLESTKNIKKNRELCIFDSDKGEVKSITSIDGKNITLSAPLDFSYSREKSNMALIKKVSLYLDEDTHILRRKVNTSPSQPLLEDVNSFAYNYDLSLNILYLGITLIQAKEKIYEVSVFPKNIALASTL